MWLDSDVDGMDDDDDNLGNGYDVLLDMQNDANLYLLLMIYLINFDPKIE